ncbi:MAG: hypothetical protein JWN48_1728 [Myxococcaceae bacterium]|nr:hypothetical protein [Myxococcaceae bacterium]
MATEPRSPKPPQAESERIPWYLPKDRRYRRRLSFTREGKLFVFVTFALGFAAVNTGTNLMYLVFGFMLSLIILSGVLSEHVLRKLRVVRRLPSRAFAGEPTLIEVAVQNEKERMVSYSVEISDQALTSSNDRRCYFLKIPPGAEQSASYRRVVAQRGVLEFKGFRIATRFPFALFEKWRETDGPGELLVYPALLPHPFAEGAAREEGDQAGSSRGRGTETRELREYRDGDEQRSIHWRRTASLGTPVVREYEKEAAAMLSILLDNRRPAAAGEAWQQSFEQNVSRAAYVAERALSRGYSVEICARGTRSAMLDGGSPPDALWRYLALLPSDAGSELLSPKRGARVVDLRSVLP